MKGQNFPVELVLTFGLGLTVAIGLITGVEFVTDGAYDSAAEAEAQFVLEEMVSTVSVMEGFNGSGVKNKSFPDELATRGYEISGESGISVTANNNYTKPLTFANLSGRGSGEIRLTKVADGEYEVS